MFSYIFLPVVWFFVARSFGISITFKESVVSWYVSSIGRYIPGKVWQFVGRVSALNHPAGKVVSAMTYEHLVFMLSAAIFSFIYPKYPLIQVFMLLILILAVVIWGYFVKFLQRFNISYAPESHKPVFLALLISTIYWAFSSLSAYFVSLSLSSNYGYRYIAFVFSFSFVASYVIPLTPAGLGIREGIILALMGYNIHSSAFSILTRLVIAIVDIVMLIFTLIYSKFAK